MEQMFTVMKFSFHSYIPYYTTYVFATAQQKEGELKLTEKREADDKRL